MRGFIVGCALAVVLQAGIAASVGWSEARAQSYTPTQTQCIVKCVKGGGESPQCIKTCTK